MSFQPSRVDPTSQLDELMQRHAAGEDRVFDELYRIMSPRLHRFCLRITAHRSEADDCLQETMLRMHRARATYRRGSNVLHWAFAIARSVHLDRLRYRRRRPEELGTTTDAAELDRLQTDESSSPEAAVRARDLETAVSLELGRMSEKLRAAYVLLREEGLSAAEAAAILGTSAAAVRQRAHRADEQLRAALGAAGWMEDDDGGRSWASPAPSAPTHRPDRRRGDFRTRHSQAPADVTSGHHRRSSSP